MTLRVELIWVELYKKNTAFPLYNMEITDKLKIFILFEIKELNI